MRIQLLFLVTIAATLSACDNTCDPNLATGKPGSCPDQFIPQGLEGGACRTGYLVQACEEGLTCIKGACIACGGYSEICCKNKKCNEGACDTSFDPYNMCVAYCGQLGEPCCPGDVCMNGAMCVQSSNSCQTATADCDGENWYLFWQVDEWGCLFGSENELIGVSADSVAEAQECATSHLYPGMHLSPPNTDVQCEDVCITSQLGQYGTTTLCGFDLPLCKQKQCVTDDEWCTVEDGPCPP